MSGKGPLKQSGPGKIFPDSRSLDGPELHWTLMARGQGSALPERHKWYKPKCEWFAIYKCHREVWYFGYFTYYLDHELV